LHDSEVNGKRYPAPAGAGLGRGASTEGADGEYVPSLAELLGAVWKRLWVVCLVTAVLVGAVVGLNLAQTPNYEASIKVLIGQRAGTNVMPLNSYSLQETAQTMVEGIDSRPVAEATIRRLGMRTTPEQFLANLSAEQVPETQYIEVRYRDPSPEKAQRVVNAVGDVFSKRISETSTSANGVTASVWERAVLPDSPVSPNPVRNGILALMFGLMLGVGLALLLEYLDDSWRSPEELEQVSGVPTFGVIPEYRIAKSKYRISKGKRGG
jgi:capsular polysaccharide biosynthesis protein